MINLLEQDGEFAVLVLIAMKYGKAWFGDRSGFSD